MAEGPLPSAAEVKAPIAAPEISIPSVDAPKPSMSPGFSGIAEGLKTNSLDVDSAFHGLAEGKLGDIKPETPTPQAETPEGKRPFMEPQPKPRVDAVKMMPDVGDGKTISDVVDPEAGLTKNEITTEAPTLDAAETGTDTEPQAEGETGEKVKTPEQEAAEQRKQALETGAELSKLGIDPNTPEGAEVFKLVAENPDQMDAVRATAGALSEVGKLSDKLGIPGAGPKAILEALTTITTTLEAQLVKLVEEAAKEDADPAKKEEAEQKSKLLKVLKALGKAVLSVVKVAASGVALAAGAGVSALGSAGKK